MPDLRWPVGKRSAVLCEARQELLQQGALQCACQAVLGKAQITICLTDTLSGFERAAQDQSGEVCTKLHTTQDQGLQAIRAMWHQ